MAKLFSYPRTPVPPYLRKTQCHPGIDAEGDDKHRLDGVNDEDEVEGILIDDAVEDEHRLDSEVPRACTIGSRHDDSDGANDESDQRAGQP